jgi:hypothetical protein
MGAPEGYDGDLTGEGARHACLGWDQAQWQWRNIDMAQARIDHVNGGGSGGPRPEFDMVDASTP